MRKGVVLRMAGSPCPDEVAGLPKRADETAVFSPTRAPTSKPDHLPGVFFSTCILLGTL